MNPIRAALQNRPVVFVLSTFAVLLGVWALFTMPRREDPKITIRTGLVLAEYPGATALQVEDQVTRRIEERLFRHAEVRKRKTFSTSRDGSVVVNVELEDWVTDPDRFWAMLRHDLNELRATELPPTVRGPVVNSNFGDVVAVLLAVRGDRYTSRDLKDFLDRIEDAIRTIPQVSKINRYGEQREEVRVSTSNARLAAFGVTPFQVMTGMRLRTRAKWTRARRAAYRCVPPVSSPTKRSSRGSLSGRPVTDNQPTSAISRQWSAATPIRRLWSASTASRRPSSRLRCRRATTS
jgi:multidrug efflux pump subunit AcrB